MPAILMPSGWGNDVNNFKTWNIQNDNIEFTVSIKEANIALIPFSINDYKSKNEWHKIKELSQLCEENEINAYGFIGGDFGKHYPELNYYDVHQIRWLLFDANIFNITELQKGNRLVALLDISLKHEFNK